MKKLFAVLLAVAMLFSLAGCGSSKTANSGSGTSTSTGTGTGTGTSTSTGTGTGSTTPEKVQTKYFTIGANPATAAAYPIWVAVGKLIEDAYGDEYVMTVSESRGAVDIANRIRSGECIFGNCVTKTDYENYTGKGDFEGDPYEGVRTMFYYGMTYYNFCVSQQSDIKSYSDLEGQRINTGGTGTTLVSITTELMNKLGINVSYYEAAKSDAGDAYANRQIVGMPTTGAIPDSFLLQLNASLPVNILPMTKEEQAKALEDHPYYVALTLPAGSYDCVKEDQLTFGYMQGCQTSTQLSQEDGYKFVKAILDTHFNDWVDTWPQAAELNLYEMLLDSPVPLHAGTVQLLVEKGYTVPSELIGPEYVPVK